MTAEEPALVMTRAQLEALPHYQSTMPTALPIGKRWRRCYGRSEQVWAGHWRVVEVEGWMVAEVVAHVPDPQRHGSILATIKWLPVSLLDASPSEIANRAG